MSRWDLEQEANDRLFKLLPEYQKQAVFCQECVDIEPDFLGFIFQYEFLSQFIPKHWTVIDLGCAYNAQCFLFQDHKRYISVDLGNIVRFQAVNCEIYSMPIEQFCKEHASSFDQDETFAICSYVPNWGADNIMIVKQNFRNVFTYYPHGGETPVLSVPTD